VIAAPLPSTNNTKQSITIGLLPPLQFLQDLLENLWRYIQSSASLPSHLPKYSSIEHRHFGSDCGASDIHHQCQTIPHHQAIAFTLIFADITWELAQTHPIKHEPSITPPKIHVNQTSPFRKWLRRLKYPPTASNNLHHWTTASNPILAEFAQELAEIHPIKCEPYLIPPKIHINQTLSFWKWLWCLCHPPTMPNNPLPPGYCFLFNFCRYHSRTCSDSSNQVRAFPHISQNTNRSNIVISEAIAVPLISTANAKQSLTIGLLPPIQFLQKLL